MKKVGVIVGRFQVPELHAGHRYLTDTVIGLRDDVLIVIGLAETISEHDPFSKEVRAKLFQKNYPKLHIAEIADHPSDEAWSKMLDQIIIDRFPDTDVTLYGSRDSFLSVYTGQFKTVYIPPILAPSGTNIRKKLFAKKIPR